MEKYLLFAGLVLIGSAIYERTVWSITGWYLQRKHKHTFSISSTTLDGLVMMIVQKKDDYKIAFDMKMGFGEKRYRAILVRKEPKTSCIVGIGKSGVMENINKN